MTGTSPHLLYPNAKKPLKLQFIDGNFLSLRVFSDKEKSNFGGFAYTDAAPGPLNRTIDAGVIRFRRHVQLPRLIPIGPDEIADRSFAGRLGILKRLARALRGERARGRAGHWTYSLNRHIGLLQAFKAERTALRTHFPGKCGRMAPHMIAGAVQHSNPEQTLGQALETHALKRQSRRVL